MLDRTRKKLIESIVTYVMFLGVGFPLGKVSKKSLGIIINNDSDFNMFKSSRALHGFLDSLHGCREGFWKIKVDKYFIYVS